MEARVPKICNTSEYCAFLPVGRSACSGASLRSPGLLSLPSSFAEKSTLLEIDSSEIGSFLKFSFFEIGGSLETRDQRGALARSSPSFFPSSSPKRASPQNFAPEKSASLKKVVGNGSTSFESLSSFSSRVCPNSAVPPK